MSRPAQVPQLPWWGWLIIAVIAINVLNTSSNLVPLLIVGAVLWVTVGPGAGRRRSPAVPPPPPPPPAETGPQAPGTRHTPGAAPGPGGPPSGPLPRIDVPSYPGDGPPPVPPPGVRSSPGPTDPTVSLGRLHLARLSRELDAAARAGSPSEVAKVLGEIDELVSRMGGLVQGGAGLPGGADRKAFASGLRSLGRQVAAARSEQPPGPRVAQVVRQCASMGQTGPHE